MRVKQFQAADRDFRLEGLRGMGKKAIFHEHVTNELRKL